MTDIVINTTHYAFANVLPFWVAWKCFDLIAHLVKTKWAIRKP